MTALLPVIGVLILFAVLGGGVAFFLGRRNRSVDTRIEEFVETESFLEFAEEEPEQQKKDVADRVDKALSTRSFFGPLRAQIAKADVKLRVSEYIVITILAGIGAAVAAYLFMSQSLVLAAVGFIVGLRIPRIYINQTAKKRMQAFNGQLGDMLNLWVNALRSGYSVLQGMETIATELPAPIGREFERVVQEVRLGLSVEQALDNMYQRVPSEDLDLIITAVNIQREVGGNLAEVLDSISFTIRERVRIKGEVRTLTAQGRASGTIITLLPVVLTLLLYTINPEYVSQLWVREDPFLIPGIFPCGWLLLGITLAMVGAGGYAIMKIVDIEV